MSKYIDAEALKEKFINTDSNGINLMIDRYVLKCIEDAPTIEVSEDCISREELLKDFGLSEKSRKYGGDHSGYQTLMLYEIQDIIEDAPSVAPSCQKNRQVERAEGEWLYTDNPLRLNDEWACSRCGNISFEKTNFCDRCGAKMKGERND